MKFQLCLFFSVLFIFSVKVLAAVEPNYDPSKPPVTTPWYGNVGSNERKADLGFIDGMKPHHAGALTMSDEYLKNKNASDPRLKKLAKGIIRNQTFEIGALAEVESFLKPPAPAHGTEWRQIATKGLAQKQRFVRSPLPTLWSVGKVSQEDVRFAKAMIVHHEGALTMCDDYLADPHARNKYLRLLCIDINKDQKLDINFMKSIIADYAGNPDDVKIDPSMIHGMEGMAHGHGQSTHSVHNNKNVVPKKKVRSPKASSFDKPQGGHQHHH
jgi:uncharacterized protein (DUF305 family)